MPTEVVGEYFDLTERPDGSLDGGPIRAIGDTNLTRYVQNDPANLTDPTGRDAQSQTPAQMDQEEHAAAH